MCATSASGTVPCGGGSTWTAGSLSSAVYTHTYTYDTLNRLTSGPGGSYTYGDSAHLDAATAILGGGSSSYTASYDAAGDMTCRAPTSATTCAGTQTGAQMTYDNERRLASWQNAPSNPTSSTSTLYDGEGNRVAQQVTNGAATTTVTYIGDLEELSTTAGVTTTTTSYYAGGQRIAQAVNGGGFSYLGSDNLGSAQVVLDGNGNPQASVLYDPYGNPRYSSGTMPGSYGYTGQHADAATGLDYYHARYYDPTAGQFTSADSVQDGLNRYAYVRGNPETATDPSGNRCVADGGVCPVGGGSNGGGTSNPPPPPSGCQSNCGGKGPSGSQTSCRVNDEQPGCQAWRIWYEGNDPSKLGGALLTQHDAANNLRRSAIPFFAAGLFFDVAAFIVELVRGFNFGLLIKAGFFLVNTVVDVMGLLTGIDPDRSAQWYALGSAFSKIAAFLHGVMAMVSGIAWWMAWTINGIYAAAKITVEGLSTVVWQLLIAALGNVVEAASDLALAHGYSIVAEAAAQDVYAMPVWDWCTGPGKGQCVPEPNGGMPEVGRP